MKKLQMRFKTAEGKKRDLVLNYINEDLEEAVTHSAMEKIVSSKIFEKDTVQLFSETLGAKYVERTEKAIF
ncbi:DUF2922 domain-containing protein [Companilactobacillus mishanensis]|uniref:DUF2922 domain-containing protein n=1 Tax=Companilactobacillus mishanensis TaxID=2486008 RepID=A0A5P0ZK13_9LACO|nr:DUF2922 domain-containing protein [Companilactobacillus mishanensis]MQS45243.1 DUF2922 domain-containing protein [Companilactobacillus mishanensis]MQS53419.1 DUF2922 domain-containing protein [Companilactobacillus mishanensis]MQS89634.1 DUF2922 domain-containing protein [Companilactobacillus mishanensis]